MKLDQKKDSQSSITLGEIITLKGGRGKIFAGEWLGVLTEGTIEPVEFDIWEVRIAIPRSKPEVKNVKP